LATELAEEEEGVEDDGERIVNATFAIILKKKNIII
jgi:hypothetical protein